MNTEEKILDLFDEYFKTTSKSEINDDVKLINELGFNGVSFEEYIEILNHSTSFSLKETGICDDIAYADFFNNLIEPINMDDFYKVNSGQASNIIECESSNFFNDLNFSSDHFLALAA